MPTVIPCGEVDGLLDGWIVNEQRGRDKGVNTRSLHTLSTSSTAQCSQHRTSTTMG